MKKVLAGVVVVLLAITLVKGVEIVDAGHTGVKKTLGKIDEGTLLPPGFHVVNPLTTTVIQMDNRVARTDNETVAYTKDVQRAKISYTMNYSLQSQSSASILNTVGADYRNKVIPQVIYGSIKQTIGQWDAIELIANQQKAATQIETVIITTLKTHGILVSNLELTSIKYDADFEKAVEDKVIAVQKAEQAKNNTVRVKEEADQRIIAAEADAQAMTIKTKALEKSPALIMYEAVQKWDGKTPKIMGGEGGNLLNIPAEMLK